MSSIPLTTAGSRGDSPEQVGHSTLKVFTPHAHVTEHAAQDVCHISVRGRRRAVDSIIDDPANQPCLTRGNHDEGCEVLQRPLSECQGWSTAMPTCAEGSSSLIPYSRIPQRARSSDWADASVTDNKAA